MSRLDKVLGNLHTRKEVPENAFAPIEPMPLARELLLSVLNTTSVMLVQPENAPSPIVVI